VSEAHLQATGSVTVVGHKKAAKVVEQVARDTEDPTVRTGHLLIALDIDGTILLEDETLSPGVVDAVEHAHRAGHEVMLATGRSWEGTHHILDALAIAPEFVVCSNGAVILRRVDGAAEGTGILDRYDRFHTETFDPTEVLGLLREHLPAAKYLVELPDGRRLFTEHLDDWNLTVDDEVPFEQLSANPVCRVVVVSPGDSEGDFLELVERIGLNEVSYAVGWTAWLDIAPQGVDKSTALERVRTWRRIAPADVLVIGDGRNDVGMFRWARENGGRAVAMAQGPQEVRDAATEVTLSVEAGGVAEILRNL